MLTSKLNHTKLKSFKLKIHAIGINSENTERIDLGDLHLSANGRNYQITFGTVEGCIQDNIIDVDIEIEDLDVCKETFADCKFDLLESDLVDDSLSATVHLSSDTIQESSVYCLQAELIYGDKHIRVKQENAIYNDNIECLELTFQGNIKDVELDLGGITIKNPRTGHEFMLDIIQTYRTDNVIQCEVQCIAGMMVDDSFGVECPMNLEVSELHENGLLCEFYLSIDDSVILKDAKLHTVNTVSMVSKEIIACPEGNVEKHRLYKHLKDFCFEIDEEEDLAQVFTDIRLDQVSEFESTYKDMSLVYCDITSDNLDTTAHVYMVLSELLILSEIEAYGVINNAA
jgi:hypothetical protein